MENADNAGSYLAIKQIVENSVHFEEAMRIMDDVFVKNNIQFDKWREGYLVHLSGNEESELFLTFAQGFQCALNYLLKKGEADES